MNDTHMLFCLPSLEMITPLMGVVLKSDTLVTAIWVLVLGAWGVRDGRVHRVWTVHAYVGKGYCGA